MADYDFIKMQKKLSKYLDEDRFEHTLGVMFTCASLAMVHGYDLKDAQAAGLLHDSAKCIPNKKKLKMCAEHNIPVTPFEKEHPFLLHAKLGAYVARAKYGITDEEILSSITFHTTGKPEMSTLEKIVYIADYIEPGRNEKEIPGLDKVRDCAFNIGLRDAVVMKLENIIGYLNSITDNMDEMTLKTYNYFKEKK